ncbi:hypothetical protein [Allomesorhizobium camelthorni]|uniref:Uncharacterized protein n=1 Tax=Allomesorhizobium camelthorni TaxID=475069 RepID=A0A6G4WN16_9HYPH|nr:hypothetical protein [Mesorhizobium camelthorni]NGO55583.1 hypothetical protein [Mesorhizobium camelthorni]
MTEFEHITTNEIVETYEATKGIFSGLIAEVRELSRKKPDAILNKGKVSIINRALNELRKVLEKEPEAKFLDILSDDDLPQTSDAVLIMVQYEKALKQFPKRYYKNVAVGIDEYGRRDLQTVWITTEFVKEYNSRSGKGR